SGPPTIASTGWRPPPPPPPPRPRPPRRRRRRGAPSRSPSAPADTDRAAGVVDGAGRVSPIWGLRAGGASDEGDDAGASVGAPCPRPSACPWREAWLRPRPPREPRRRRRRGAPSGL